MKIPGNQFGFGFSAKGMSIQRKKMDIISQNIANADSVRDANGNPYRRKFMTVTANQNSFAQNLSVEGKQLQLAVTESSHMTGIESKPLKPVEVSNSVKISEFEDKKQGDLVYMPEHPDANPDGYVEMSNVNVITEMVDMIAATRSFEANVTAMNSTKQMLKDSLEI